MGNATGLNRNYGNGIAIDEKSNATPKSGSKRIGPIDGRLKRYTLGHNAGTGGHDANGMNKGFGNGIPGEEPEGGLPSRGNKDGG